MKKAISFGVLAGFYVALSSAMADEVLFNDDFVGGLDRSWSWIREHHDAWRTTTSGLEVRVEPGNMWGAANNAKNVLVRELPVSAGQPTVFSAKVENRPTEQYEQVDLVCYFDDSHMVKLGQELVDGQLSIVMGREERDRTRTIAIIPLKTFSVELRLSVKGKLIQGAFRPASSEKWQTAGECDLPADGPAKVSLQFYQGPTAEAHWARVSEFQIRGGEK